MTALTIPKKMAKEDIVLIPRREYEDLLRARLSIVPEVPMTADEKRALIHARKEMRLRRTFSFDELSRKLGFRNRK